MGDHLIDIVDENDVVIGTATKHDAQKKGLRHRVARVSLEDSYGNILLQKRRYDKELYPDCWDLAASGHLECGEAYLAAAKRELYEELGVVADLMEVKYYQTSGQTGWRRLNRSNKLYKGVIPAETTFCLQADEVAEVRWVTVAELRKLLKNHPGEIADGLQEVYEIMYT
ncbi:NUDIX domain-containing protein [Candidatus Saccharibacteria bacterium]|nr:NUDIX domain-containing protein [Candidatus Saccharibacteria bacterium]